MPGAVSARYGSTRIARATSIRAYVAWSVHTTSPRLTTAATSVANSSAGPPESPRHGCEGSGTAVSSSSPTSEIRAVPSRFTPLSPTPPPVVPQPTPSPDDPIGDALRDSAGEPWDLTWLRLGLTVVVVVVGVALLVRLVRALPRRERTVIL